MHHFGKKNVMLAGLTLLHPEKPPMAQWLMKTSRTNCGIDDFAKAADTPFTLGRACATTRRAISSADGRRLIRFLSNHSSCNT